MHRGRYICDTLKAVRRQIAEANEIEYEPHECRHEGPCRGTCPACEAEVRYLEHELDVRRHLGKAVAVVGLSVGLAGLTSGCASKKGLTDPSRHNGSEIDQPLQGDVVPEEHMLAGIPAIPDEVLQKTDSAELKPVATTEDDKLFGDAGEQMPTFRGGEQALKAYVEEHLRNPDNREGRVVVTFMIERDGSITEAKVVRSSDSELDKEALRVVSAMPKWLPGKRSGESFRVKYTLPVTFKKQ